MTRAKAMAGAAAVVLANAGEPVAAAPVEPTAPVAPAASVDAVAVDGGDPGAGTVAPLVEALDAELVADEHGHDLDVAPDEPGGDVILRLRVTALQELPRRRAGYVFDRNGTIFEADELREGNDFPDGDAFAAIASDPSLRVEFDSGDGVWTPLAARSDAVSSAAD